MRFTGPGFRPAGNKLPRPVMIDPEISQSYGFYYYYEVTLPANSQRTDAQLLDRDADFVWRGVNCLIGYATYIGVRFKDANGFYFPLLGCICGINRLLYKAGTSSVGRHSQSGIFIDNLINISRHIAEFRQLRSLPFFGLPHFEE